jgi:hypothetical protein
VLHEEPGDEETLALQDRDLVDHTGAERETGITQERGENTGEFEAAMPVPTPSNVKYWTRSFGRRMKISVTAATTCFATAPGTATHEIDGTAGAKFAKCTLLSGARKARQDTTVYGRPVKLLRDGSKLAR